MGSLNLNFNKSKCLDVVKEEKLRLRLGQAELDSSSQLDVSIVSSARVTMLPVLVLELQSIWLLSWSTLLLRSLSWLAMLPVITRRPESSQDIFNLPSGMMRS